MNKRLLIVGNPDPVHIGKHFFDAAAALSIPTTLLDTRMAGSTSRLINRIFWHLLDHRPPRQFRFNQQVHAAVRDFKPTHVLSTGITPLTAPTVHRLTSSGIQCLNYSTDDPWNPVHRSSWHQRTLPHFSKIFTPRNANRPDFIQAGCKKVEIMPFGYSTSSHFITDTPTVELVQQINSGDILFAGGADNDRLKYVQALIAAGIKPILYGNSWQRHSWALPFYQGFLSLESQRYLISRIPLCLVLVRRANRDGHSMRSYELPAMGGCLVTERTQDHESLFGADGHATRYFNSIEHLLLVCRSLKIAPEQRIRMANMSHDIITRGNNSYLDRLSAILSKSISDSPDC